MAARLGCAGTTRGTMSPADQCHTTPSYSLKEVMELSFSHVGICVSDLERSLRFYCEGLGFEVG